jgi:polysaccharide biosynthesis protein PslG
MKLRIALILVTLVLSLAISADRTSNNCSEAWSATANKQTLESGLGVNIHFTEPQPGEIKLIADAGFRWVRMDFVWDVTERERGRYDFAAYDRLMSELDRFNIRALFILDYGHRLYGGWPPRSEAAQQAFARWAVAAAKHFSNRGVIWEVYNEPNVKLFWPPRPKAEEYIALALGVGRAFRAEVPNEKLIGPATNGIDFAFIEACFKAGLLEYWSAVSVHPYRKTDPETVANDYCRLRKLIQQYSPPYRTGSGLGSPRGQPAWGGGSDRVIPIISGEWGYSAAWRDFDEAKQSALIAREMLTNAANGIPLSIWYDWRDDGTDATEAEHHFGVVRNAFQPEGTEPFKPKPGYAAVKTVSEFFNGYTFEQRLTIGSDDDYVLVFTRDGQKRFAAWTTSTTRRRIVIPLGPGSFTITRHNGDSGGRISATPSGAAIEISTTPLYLAPVR